MTEISKESKSLELIEDNRLVGIGFDSKGSFELTQRASTMLAKSDLVPKVFKGSVSNCFIALNMSHRMKADPLMVMQNLNIIYGRPSFSAQFLISCFNIAEGFSKLRYEFKGERGDEDWGCRATAVEKSSGEELKGTWITIDMAQKEGWYDKKGSKWQTMPEQMLRYRAASYFIRAYAPEISMGMYTTEEMNDINEDEIKAQDQGIGEFEDFEVSDQEPDSDSKDLKQDSKGNASKNEEKPENDKPEATEQENKDSKKSKQSDSDNPDEIEMKF